MSIKLVLFLLCSPAIAGERFIPEPLNGYYKGRSITISNKTYIVTCETFKASQYEEKCNAKRSVPANFVGKSELEEVLDALKSWILQDQRLWLTEQTYKRCVLPWSFHTHQSPYCYTIHSVADKYVYGTSTCKDSQYRGLCVLSDVETQEDEIENVSGYDDDVVEMNEFQTETTASTTPVSANVSTPNNDALCTCARPQNMSLRGVSTEEIREALYVDSRKTSFWQRRLNSAQDPRLSSRSAGILSILLLVFVGVLVIVSDLVDLIRGRSAVGVSKA